MLNSRATFEGLKQLDPNERPFVMTRASYAGGQRYAVTWTGDNSSTWNHLKLSIPMLLNLGMSGFAYSGADVGGFIGAPSPELMTRWIEIAAFAPIFRAHSEKGTPPKEPWVDGAEHTAYSPAVHRAALSADALSVRPCRRERANRSSAHAAAVLRFSGRPRCAVRPTDCISTGRSSADRASPELGITAGLRDLPACRPLVRLLDRRAGDCAASAKSVSATVGAPMPQVITVTPALDRLPVFVRAGAILPGQALVQSTSETPQGPLSLDVYPGDDCRGTIYADDGHSMAYAQTGLSSATSTLCADRCRNGYRLRCARGSIPTVVAPSDGASASLEGRGAGVPRRQTHRGSRDAGGSIERDHRRSKR